jgi:hypothetical protein
VFTMHGLPSSLYTESRQQLLPHAAGERSGGQGPADPGRPGAEASGSGAHPGLFPQARGRSERMFGTLQSRLIKELAKAGLTEIDAAKRPPGRTKKLTSKKATEAASVDSKAHPVAAISD